MADADDNSKQLITSLLTEHFRYTPITLIDDIINTVNELVFRAVTAVEEGLTNAPPETLGFAEKATAEGKTIEKDESGNAQYPEAKLEIENGVHQLETLLEATVDKTFDKLEIYVLRNILTVPPELASWIQLSHYEGLDLTTKSPTDPTPESLFVLRRKLQETRRLHNALVAEHRRNAELINQLNQLLSPSSVGSTELSPPDGCQNNPTSLSFLTSSPTARTLGLGQDESSQLISHTKFAISQLPALRQLLETLKPKVESVQKAPLRQDEEERRDYIETQARRQLEKSGIDVESGEGLIGHSKGPGKKFTRDDVHAIEGLIGTLGGEQRRAAEDPMEE